MHLFKYFVLEKQREKNIRSKRRRFRCLVIKFKGNIITLQPPQYKSLKYMCHIYLFSKIGYSKTLVKLEKWVLKIFKSILFKRSLCLQLPPLQKRINIWKLYNLLEFSVPHFYLLTQPWHFIFCSASVGRSTSE